MSASNFHAVSRVPDSVAGLHADVVVEVLSRHGVNVSDAAGELGVASADLRRLLCANPISPRWQLSWRSVGSIWRRKTFTRLCAAMTAAGGTQRVSLW